MDYRKISRNELERLLSMALDRLEKEHGSNSFDLMGSELYYHTKPEEKFPSVLTAEYPVAGLIGDLREDVEFLSDDLQRGVYEPRATLIKLAVVLEYISHNTGFKKRC